VNRAVALRGSDGPELRRLIDRCRRDDEGAWEVLYGVVRRVAAPILATFRLREVDREEILASLWEPLMTALKRGSRPARAILRSPPTSGSLCAIVR
jgi:hypothetical protein